jgi:DNA polymerase III sliding clamp (beta) subunit (PCNA family)
VLDDTESFSDVWTKLNKWMSKTHPSPYSRGFYFDISAKKGKDDAVKSKLLIVGTNTAQIGICDVKVGGIVAEGAWNFMVPYDNMEFCKNIPGGIKSTLSFDANFLNISYGTLKVMLTLMGVQFPPYKTIIPGKDTTSRIEVPTKDFSDALERLSYIQNSTTVSFARVSFVEAGFMNLSVATQTGEGEERIPIVSEKKFDGFPDTMFFSVPTMQNYCKSLKKTDGNIILGIQNERKPMILKPSEAEMYYLITIIPSPDDCMAAEKKIKEIGKKEKDAPKTKEDEVAPKGEEEPPATGTDNPPAEGEEGA